MKATEQVQSDVVDELAWDATVDSSKIAVTVSSEGTVTLKGTVPNFLEIHAAERATKRVAGVKAVANDLEVEFDGRTGKRDDTAIAEDALHALQSSVSVPHDKVVLTVSGGWITLEGDVEWDYQRRAAFAIVRDRAGVTGVTNRIRVAPRAAKGEVKKKIENAFRRAAEIDAEHVSVNVTEGRVKLGGYVRSWSERTAAEEAAWLAPGVTEVVNDIDVRSHVRL